eukprot:scaffold128423_cov66-Phaeocystis_antarctica.AAC.2
MATFKSRAQPYACNSAIQRRTSELPAPSSKNAFNFSCQSCRLGRSTSMCSDGYAPSMHVSTHVLRALNEAPWRLLDCIRQNALALGSLADFRTSTNGKDTRSGCGRSTACVAASKLAESQCSMFLKSHVVFLPLHAMYWSARSRSTCAIMRGKAKC